MERVAAAFRKKIENYKSKDEKEQQAARVIQREIRIYIQKLRIEEQKAWLPLDIDPKKANFSDVEKVLKVLDNYALKKLAKLEDEPTLP